MSSKPLLPPSLFITLWAEGFFNKSKKIDQIAERLAEDGYHFKSSSHLSLALLRSMRKEKFLTRRAQSGQWGYIQSHPHVFSEKQKPSTSKRAALFDRYELHPRIKEVSFKQFQDGYFKEAIQNSLVEVIDQVKIKSGRPKITSNGRAKDLDGDDLMNQIFGCDGAQVPKISFNSLQDGLDKAEQRGLMYLFKGIVGIRDRKAHLNFVQNDPLKTMEYLSLASLLMRLLDENANLEKKSKK